MIKTSPETASPHFNVLPTNIEKTTAYLENAGIVGESLLPVYLLGAEFSPAVAQAEITQTDPRAKAQAYMYKEGYRDIVAVSTNVADYRSVTLNSLKQMEEYCGISEDRINGELLAQYRFGHELGHVADLEGLSEKEVKAIRQREMHAFPLPGVDPNRLRGWLSNDKKRTKLWREYGDYFREIGISNDEELNIAQSVAYNNSPTEQAAHRFAAKIIVTLHPSLNVTS